MSATGILSVMSAIAMQGNTEVVSVRIGDLDGGVQVFRIAFVRKVKNMDGMSHILQLRKKMACYHTCHVVLFQPVSPSSGSLGVSDV